MPYQIKNGIVYGSNAVSLTQAQYDALSTAEKNNGTVYYIYDSDDAVFDAEDVGLADGGNVQTLAGSVAIIETSPATATHAVGDYIVWNGQLYEVITAIAVGETLTVGTNITSTTVGEELTSLNNGLTNLIKTQTVTDTTSSAGVIPLSIQFSRIIAIKPRTGYVCYGSVREATSGNGAAFFFSSSGGSITTLTNTEVKFDVLYI